MKKSYKRKPGDLEIRILKDGSVVSVSPDEKFLEIINEINNQSREMETNENAANNVEQSE